jgi:hypothetical protein
MRYRAASSEQVPTHAGRGIAMPDRCRTGRTPSHTVEYPAVRNARATSRPAPHEPHCRPHRSPARLTVRTATSLLHDRRGQRGYSWGTTQVLQGYCTGTPGVLHGYSRLLGYYTGTPHDAESGMANVARRMNASLRAMLLPLAVRATHRRPLLPHGEWLWPERRSPPIDRPRPARHTAR